MIDKKIIIFWTCLCLGIVLILIAAKHLRGKPKVIQMELTRVTDVVDGDTIKVEFDDKIETVRMIGIDAPESVDPRKEVECFATEAAKQAEELLSGKEIFLIADETQSDRDTYGRLLRYVSLEDGSSVGKVMLSGGFAREYTFKTPYRYRDEYRKLQAEAKINRRGLWGICSE